MSASPTAARRAAVVAATPLILITALALHPYLPGRQPNIDALATAVSSNPTRWGLVHLATGLGSAVLAVAFLIVSTHLTHAGEDRWSRRGLPLVMVGCSLYAMLPAMELAPLAAVESGADPGAAQAALHSWFLPVLLASAVTFGAGAVCFALSVARSGILAPAPSKLVAASLVVMALSRFVPLSAVQFYVQSLACYAAFLPLAYSMWKPATAAHVTSLVSSSTSVEPRPT
jgi:hypothetical protein